jgi:putative membrane protein
MQAGKRAAFALTLVVFALSWIAPRWPLEQALHSSLTVVGLIWLWRHDRRWPLSVGAFALVCGFIALHCVGARWLYSNVPYEQWLQAAFGWSPAAAFGWQRNHFDRLIHLLYGLCFAPAVFAWLRQRWPLTPRQAFAIMLMLIMCSSLVYEWLEWAIALGLSPEAAESYNGQQGDPWDAHADMLLATLGAAVTWPWLGRAAARRVHA